MRRSGHEVDTADTANFALARVVYIGRQFEGAPDEPQWVENRDAFRKMLAELKTAIAEDLTEAVAAGNLNTRPDFAKVLRETVLAGSNEASVVTTNWDGSVERATRKIYAGIPVRYLHGSTEGPGTIYLPTEMAEEPYRTREETAALVGIRADLAAAVDQASRVVLYGLSVSPLDAELGQVLASGMNNGSVEEVHVVNPSYREVGARVATLLDNDSGHVRIFGCHPARLRDIKELTPRRPANVPPLSR